MNQRRLTPGYIFFYIVFSAEAWRVLCGIITSYFLVPQIMPADIGPGGMGILYIMAATIGYSAFGVPARWITRRLKQVTLGGKQS